MCFMCKYWLDKGQFDCLTCGKHFSKITLLLQKFKDFIASVMEVYKNK